MFQTSIIAALRTGPKRTREQYEYARVHQLQDWDSTTPCPHRDRIRPDDLESQHQLRRDQQVLKRQRRIELNGDLWRLRSN